MLICLPDITRIKRIVKSPARNSNPSLINESGMKVFIAGGEPLSPKSINRADNRMRARIIDFIDFIDKHPV